MTTVTLDLPQDLYQLAQHTAQHSRKPVEQVLLDWIQPPTEVNELDLHHELAALELQTTNELMQVVHSTLPQCAITRLQDLLSLQQQRPLTIQEAHETQRLVEQEDRQTLRKAKALSLLKSAG